MLGAVPTIMRNPGCEADTLPICHGRSQPLHSSLPTADAWKAGIRVCPHRGWSVAHKSTTAQACRKLTAVSRSDMGKPSRDAEPQERTVSPACEAQPPLKPVAEGPLSPTRSTNIAESSREPEGRLQVADELAVRIVVCLLLSTDFGLVCRLSCQRSRAGRERLVRDPQTLASQSALSPFVSSLISKPTHLPCAGRFRSTHGVTPKNPRA